MKNNDKCSINAFCLVTQGGGGDDTNQYITIHEYNNNALNYLCTLRQYALGPVLRCLTSLPLYIGYYHSHFKIIKSKHCILLYFKSMIPLKLHFYGNHLCVIFSLSSNAMIFAKILKWYLLLYEWWWLIINSTKLFFIKAKTETADCQKKCFFGGNHWVFSVSPQSQLLHSFFGWNNLISPTV